MGKTALEILRQPQKGQKGSKKMARMKTENTSIDLFGHGLQFAGNVDIEPRVSGHFEAETVTGRDGREYALFVVPDEVEACGHFSGNAGTYRVDCARLSPDHFAE